MKNQTKQSSICYLVLAITNTVILLGLFIWLLEGTISNIIDAIKGWHRGPSILYLSVSIVLVLYLIVMQTIALLKTKTQVTPKSIFCQICLLSSICVSVITYFSLGVVHYFSAFNDLPEMAFGTPITVLFFIDFIGTTLLSFAILAFIICYKQDVSKKLKTIICILLIVLPVLNLIGTIPHLIVLY